MKRFWMHFVLSGQPCVLASRAPEISARRWHIGAALASEQARNVFESGFEMNLRFLRGVFCGGACPVFGDVLVPGSEAAFPPAPWLAKKRQRRLDITGKCCTCGGENVLNRFGTGRRDFGRFWVGFCGFER